MPRVRVQVKRQVELAGAFGLSINRRQDEVIVGDLTDAQLDALRKQLRGGEQ